MKEWHFPKIEGSEPATSVKMSSFTSIFQLFLSYLLLGFRNVGTTIFRKVEQMFFEDFEASDVASEISIPLNKNGCSSSGDQILDIYISIY